MHWEGGVHVPVGSGILSRPPIGPTQCPVHWVPRDLSPGVKRLRRKADYSQLVQSKKKWIYHPLLPYAFMANQLSTGTILPFVSNNTWCVRETNDRTVRRLLHVASKNDGHHAHGFLLINGKSSCGSDALYQQRIFKSIVWRCCIMSWSKTGYKGNKDLN
jgi:hypothetical protein